jgi:hypothetical protein
VPRARHTRRSGAPHVLRASVNERLAARQTRSGAASSSVHSAPSCRLSGAAVERIVQAFSMRWYGAAELEHLLSRAGFGVLLCVVISRAARCGMRRRRSSSWPRGRTDRSAIASSLPHQSERTWHGDGKRGRLEDVQSRPQISWPSLSDLLEGRGKDAALRREEDVIEEDEVGSRVARRDRRLRLIHSR